MSGHTLRGMKCKTRGEELLTRNDKGVSGMIRWKCMMVKSVRE